MLFLAHFVTVYIQGQYDSCIGSQTVSTIIRAMAVEDIGPRHVLRIIGKEALTGLSLGIVMGVLMYGRAMLIGDGSTEIAITVGLTILALTTWAATIGAILPIILDRLKFDPAVVSAPFISSLVDGTGLIIYCTLAGIMLGL